MGIFSHKLCLERCKIQSDKTYCVSCAYAQRVIRLDACFWTSMNVCTVHNPSMQLRKQTASKLQLTL